MGRGAFEVELGSLGLQLRCLPYLSCRYPLVLAILHAY